MIFCKHNRKPTNPKFGRCKDEAFDFRSKIIENTLNLVGPNGGRSISGGGKPICGGGKPLLGGGKPIWGGRENVIF